MFQKLVKFLANIFCKKKPPTVQYDYRRHRKRNPGNRDRNCPPPIFIGPDGSPVRKKRRRRGHRGGRKHKRFRKHGGGRH